MKATIEIKKSFDATTEFSKEWIANDFETFFRKEGEYLDMLALCTKVKGDDGDTWTVTYTVTLKK